MSIVSPSFIARLPHLVSLKSNFPVILSNPCQFFSFPSLSLFFFFSLAMAYHTHQISHLKAIDHVQNHFRNQCLRPGGTE